MRGKRTEQGFTLVEVLVALVILGTSLVFIAGSWRTAVAATAVSVREGRALAIAEDLVEEARIPPDLPLGTEAGTLTDSGLAMNWTRSVESLGEGLALVAVRVEVTWHERGQVRSVVLATYVHQADL